MIDLFPDEQLVSSSDENSVVLTTHRIIYEYKELGKAFQQSILLEHVSSCENYYYSKFWYLITGLITLVAALGWSDIIPASFFVLLLAASVFQFLVYVYTKKNVIAVGSASIKIIITVTGMERNDILAFINQIEHTVNQRNQSLKRL
ncbi:hypothetical protein [Gynurincola endophyticus]|uniref:hypothetical protein n=1 Tax=Gynurincola endophyticus TaxID=2479004 RepID=UPI000F8D3539|nr:hypothetical protein [Gynurincola endophyticus]